jgi:hypothetical protein
MLVVVLAGFAGYAAHSGCRRDARPEFPWQTAPRGRGSLTARRASSAEPRTLDEPAQPVVTVVLRDLANGAAVPDLEVEVDRGAATPLTLRSDSAGSVGLPTGWTRLRATHSDWTASNGDPSATARDGVVWLFRRIRVHGRVVAEADGAPVSSATVVCRVAGAGPARDETLEHYAWADSWVRARQIELGAELRVREDASFVMDAPAIAGLHVRATAPGWAPSVAPVTEPSSTSAQLLLRMRRQITVRGRLSSSDGTPLRGAQVWIRVSTIRSGSALPTPEERLSGNAVTFGVGADGRGVLVSRQRVWTHADGSFELPLPGPGEAKIDAFAAEHHVRTVSLGLLDANRDDVALVAERAVHGTRLQLRTGPEVLRNARFLATDLSTDDGVEVYNDFVDVDSDGRVPSEWLVPGHRYRFLLNGRGVPGGRRTGFVRWTGQPQLDILQLSMERDLE